MGTKAPGSSSAATLSCDMAGPHVDVPMWPAWVQFTYSPTAFRVLLSVRH